MGNILFLFYDFTFQMTSHFFGVFLKPLGDFIFKYILGVDNWLDVLDNFLNTYFYNGIGFAKNVIINVTGIPNEFFSVVAHFLFWCFELFIITLSVKFILNAISLFRTGRSISNIGGK